MNGLRINGTSLNGLRVNGTSLNGLRVNGASLNGLRINGASLSGVNLVGGELRGVAPDGSPIGGASFAGVEAQALLSDASTLTLRIDGARSSGDLWLYEVSYPTASGPKPLCGLDAAGAPIEAIALAGRWNLAEGVPGGGSWIDDPAMFTFGCRDAALAKCVELGYKPWASAGGISLRSHHQACTRLIRADYCGNGQPGTLDGWQINLYDALGIQADTESGAAWVFEGKWGPAGAVCVDEYRLLELVASGPVPDCALAKLTGTCAAGGFAGGVLLQSEYNSAGLIELVRDIVNGSPDAKLADKVEDALAELEGAFAELAESPPDRLAAVGKLEDAVGDLKATINAGTLPPGYGNGLANRITGVARFQATATIDANACGAKKPSELTKAKLLRAEGDKRRSTGDYKGACGKYKGAIDKAEDALGSPCPP
ncbi:MAG TPA: ADYC domain-containing protein [Polyangiaceae bacterium]|nr:ADYC domain-containing protein [Polyangiaceae bacterium]